MLYADLDFERPPWDTISQDARALIVALLQRDADRRPTALEALSFRYELRPAAQPRSIMCCVLVVAYVTTLKHRCSMGKPTAIKALSMNDFAT